jgi:hypothetical protein
MHNLVTERQNFTFNPRNLSAILYGGDENLRIREEATKLIEQDELFKDDETYHDKTTAQLRER